MNIQYNSKHKRSLRYSICISGAAAGKTVDADMELAEQLGEAVAKSGQILTTGATVGLPYYAAIGAKKAGGMSIGFSPAASLREHLRKYRLPYDCYDFVNFTGLHYVGRDLYLVQSSDALITVGGRFGSLHEFTSALEAGKPCGILIGSGGAADVIPNLMSILEPPHDELVIYDQDPAKLVQRVIELIDHKYKDIHEELASHDEHWFLTNGVKPPRSG
jgi:uncharacterized protein (TIGR00725 family)